MLGMHELGDIRRLGFNDAWATILTSNGLKHLSLEDLFRQWVRYVYLITGMENALRNDYGFAQLAATGGERPDDVTPFKLQFLIEAHRRFLISYLDGLVDEDLQAI